MDIFAAILALALLNIFATIMAAFVDHRTRRRIRAGDLPPRSPWLLLWGNSGIDLFYLFSPLFPRLQDRTTRWLIWPLRLIIGGSILAVLAAIVALGVRIWLNPSGT